jgi:hypothetical protein
MASALQIVPTLKKASGTQLHIDLKAAPANDNDPVVQSIRKAWEDREQLSLLVKEVTETSIWQEMMPMFGILADILIEPAPSKAKRIELQKTLKEAILLMWYSYMQSRGKLVLIDKKHVGRSTIRQELLPLIKNDRASLKTVLNNEETHNQVTDGLNSLSKKLIPLCASTITDNPDEQTLIVRFLTLVRQIISEVSLQKNK